MHTIHYFLVPVSIWLSLFQAQFSLTLSPSREPSVHEKGRLQNCHPERRHANDEDQVTWSGRPRHVGDGGGAEGGHADHNPCACVCLPGAQAVRPATEAEEEIKKKQKLVKDKIAAQVRVRCSRACVHVRLHPSRR